MNTETFTIKGREFPVKKTGATKTVAGELVECWRFGIGRYDWRTPDGRICIGSNFNMSGYNVSVDGNKIEGTRPGRSKDFRSFEAAMKAALKACTPR